MLSSTATTSSSTNSSSTVSASTKDLTCITDHYDVAAHNNAIIDCRKSNGEEVDIKGTLSTVQPVKKKKKKCSKLPKHTLEYDTLEVQMNSDNYILPSEGGSEMPFLLPDHNGSKNDLQSDNMSLYKVSEKLSQNQNDMSIKVNESPNQKIKRTAVRKKKKDPSVSNILSKSMPIMQEKNNASFGSIETDLVSILSQSSTSCPKSSNLKKVKNKAKSVNKISNDESAYDDNTKSKIITVKPKNSETECTSVLNNEAMQPLVLQQTKKSYVNEPILKQSVISSDNEDKVGNTEYGKGKFDKLTPAISSPSTKKKKESVSHRKPRNKMSKSTPSLIDQIDTNLNLNTPEMILKKKNLLNASDFDSVKPVVMSGSDDVMKVNNTEHGTCIVYSSIPAISISSTEKKRKSVSERRCKKNRSKSTSSLINDENANLKANTPEVLSADGNVISGSDDHVLKVDNTEHGKGIVDIFTFGITKASSKKKKSSLSERKATKERSKSTPSLMDDGDANLNVNTPEVMIEKTDFLNAADDNVESVKPTVISGSDDNVMNVNHTEHCFIPAISTSSTKKKKVPVSETRSKKKKSKSTPSLINDENDKLKANTPEVLSADGNVISGSDDNVLKVDNTEHGKGIVDIFTFGITKASSKKKKSSLSERKATKERSKSTPSLMDDGDANLNVNTPEVMIEKTDFLNAADDNVESVKPTVISGSDDNVMNVNHTEHCFIPAISTSSTKKKKVPVSETRSKKKKSKSTPSLINDENDKLKANTPEVLSADGNVISGSDDDVLKVDNTEHGKGIVDIFTLGISKASSKKKKSSLSERKSTKERSKSTFSLIDDGDANLNVNTPEVMIEKTDFLNAADDNVESVKPTVISGSDDNVLKVNHTEHCFIPAISTSSTKKKKVPVSERRPKKKNLINNENDNLKANTPEVVSADGNVISGSDDHVLKVDNTEHGKGIVDIFNFNISKASSKKKKSSLSERKATKERSKSTPSLIKDGDANLNVNTPEVMMEKTDFLNAADDNVESVKPTVISGSDENVMNVNKTEHCFIPAISTSSTKKKKVPVSETRSKKKKSKSTPSLINDENANLKANTPEVLSADGNVISGSDDHVLKVDNTEHGKGIVDIFTFGISKVSSKKKKSSLSERKSTKERSKSTPSLINNDDDNLKLNTSEVIYDKLDLVSNACDNVNTNILEGIQNISGVKILALAEKDERNLIEKVKHLDQTIYKENANTLSKRDDKVARKKKNETIIVKSNNEKYVTSDKNLLVLDTNEDTNAVDIDYINLSILDTKLDVKTGDHENLMTTEGLNPNKNPFQSFKNESITKVDNNLNPKNSSNTHTVNVEIISDVSNKGSDKPLAKKPHKSRSVIVDSKKKKKFPTKGLETSDTNIKAVELEKEYNKIIPPLNGTAVTHVDVGSLQENGMMKKLTQKSHLSTFQAQKEINNRKQNAFKCASDFVIDAQGLIPKQNNNSSEPKINETQTGLLKACSTPSHLQIANRKPVKQISNQVSSDNAHTIDKHEDLHSSLPLELPDNKGTKDLDRSKSYKTHYNTFDNVVQFKSTKPVEAGSTEVISKIPDPASINFNLDCNSSNNATRNDDTYREISLTDGEFNLEIENKPKLCVLSAEAQTTVMHDINDIPINTSEENQNPLDFNVITHTMLVNTDTEQIDVEPSKSRSPVGNISLSRLGHIYNPPPSMDLENNTKVKQKPCKSITNASDLKHVMEPGKYKNFGKGELSMDTSTPLKVTQNGIKKRKKSHIVDNISENYVNLEEKAAPLYHPESEVSQKDLMQIKSNFISTEKKSAIGQNHVKKSIKKKTSTSDILSDVAKAKRDKNESGNPENIPDYPFIKGEEMIVGKKNKIKQNTVGSNITTQVVNDPAPPICNDNVSQTTNPNFVEVCTQIMIDEFPELPNKIKKRKAKKSKSKSLENILGYNPQGEAFLQNQTIDIINLNNTTNSGEELNIDIHSKLPTKLVKRKKRENPKMKENLPSAKDDANMLKLSNDIKDPMHFEVSQKKEKMTPRKVKKKHQQKKLEQLQQEKQLVTTEDNISDVTSQNSEYFDTQEVGSDVWKSEMERSFAASEVSFNTAVSSIPEVGNLEDDLLLVGEKPKKLKKTKVKKSNKKQKSDAKKLNIRLNNTGNMGAEQNKPSQETNVDDIVPKQDSEERVWEFLGYKLSSVCNSMVKEFDDMTPESQNIEQASLESSNSSEEHYTDIKSTVSGNLVDDHKVLEDSSEGELNKSVDLIGFGNDQKQMEGSGGDKKKAKGRSHTDFSVKYDANVPLKQKSKSTVDLRQQSISESGTNLERNLSIDILCEDETEEIPYLDSFSESPEDVSTLEQQSRELKSVLKTNAELRKKQLYDISNFSDIQFGESFKSIGLQSSCVRPYKSPVSKITKTSNKSFLFSPLFGRETWRSSFLKKTFETSDNVNLQKEIGSSLSKPSNEEITTTSTELKKDRITSSTTNPVVKPSTMTESEVFNVIKMELVKDNASLLRDNTECQRRKKSDVSIPEIEVYETGETISYTLSPRLICCKKQDVNDSKTKTYNYTNLMKPLPGVDKTISDLFALEDYIQKIIDKSFEIYAGTHGSKTLKPKSETAADQAAEKVIQGIEANVVDILHKCGHNITCSTDDNKQLNTLSQNLSSNIQTHYLAENKVPQQPELMDAAKLEEEHKKLFESKFHNSDESEEEEGGGLLIQGISVMNDDDVSKLFGKQLKKIDSISKGIDESLENIIHESNVHLEDGTAVPSGCDSQNKVNQFQDTSELDDLENRIIKLEKKLSSPFTLSPGDKSQLFNENMENKGTSDREPTRRDFPLQNTGSAIENHASETKLLPSEYHFLSNNCDTCLVDNKEITCSYNISALSDSEKESEEEPHNVILDEVSDSSLEDEHDKHELSVSTESTDSSVEVEACISEGTNYRYFDSGFGDAARQDSENDELEKAMVVFRSMHIDRSLHTIPEDPEISNSSDESDYHDDDSNKDGHGYSQVDFDSFSEDSETDKQKYENKTETEEENGNYTGTTSDDLIDESDEDLENNVQEMSVQQYSEEDQVINRRHQQRPELNTSSERYEPGQFSLPVNTKVTEINSEQPQRQTSTKCLTSSLPASLPASQKYNQHAQEKSFSTSVELRNVRQKSPKAANATATSSAETLFIEKALMESFLSNIGSIVFLILAVIVFHLMDLWFIKEKL